jgi:hypothetical protein
MVEIEVHAHPYPCKGKQRYKEIRGKKKERIHTPLARHDRPVLCGQECADPAQQHPSWWQ